MKEARTFMFTIHSMKPIAISIDEISQTKDYDDLVNRLILERFGESIEEKKGLYKVV